MPNILILAASLSVGVIGCLQTQTGVHEHINVPMDRGLPGAVVRLDRADAMLRSLLRLGCGRLLLSRRISPTHLLRCPFDGLECIGPPQSILVRGGRLFALGDRHQLHARDAGESRLLDLVDRCWLSLGILRPHVDRLGRHSERILRESSRTFARNIVRSHCGSKTIDARSKQTRPKIHPLAYFVGRERRFRRTLRLMMDRFASDTHPT